MRISDWSSDVCSSDLWEPSDDLKVWDITLREGVMFHDGREMMADDVVSSFKFHQISTGYAKQIVNVEKNGRKVRMTLDAPNSEVPYVLAEYHLMIMPAADTRAEERRVGQGWVSRC